MQTLSVDLDEETLQALEVERSLIGFESREAYVRWIVAHRAAIEHETEMGDVLNAYSDRIARLESRLESIESGEDDSTTKMDDPAHDPSSGTAALEPTTGDRSGEHRSATSDGGWAASDSSDSDGPRSSPTPAEQTAAEADIQAANLRPERVERIRDDRLSDDAGVLGTVEVDRLDELSRRAVAKTRDQLDRDVETGIEYRSSTSLADTDSDVRPGEDITDLSDLSVPGRSEDLVERRRELIGVALAQLRDEGSARKGDFVDALYEEYPAGYGSTGGWWRCLKHGLKQVDRVEGGDGSRIWRLAD